MINTSLFYSKGVLFDNGCFFAVMFFQSTVCGILNNIPLPNTTWLGESLFVVWGVPQVT